MKPQMFESPTGIPKKPKSDKDKKIIEKKDQELLKFFQEIFK